MSDFWNDAKGLLGTIAPVIGTALGGPVGGAAAKLLSNALFGREDASEEDIKSALTNSQLTPEQFAAIKLADVEFKKHLDDNKIKLDEISAKDRDSARGLTAKLAEAKHGAAWSSTIISCVVTLGFFWVLYQLMSSETALEPTKEKILLILLGSLGAGFTQVLNFWLGSSKGSKDKTEALSNAMKK